TCTAAAAWAPFVPLAGASIFMCWEPVAKAMLSFVQLRNWKLTSASRLSRTCSSAAAGIPVITVPDLPAAVRVNAWIQPRLIHGAGGASRSKPLSTDGSNDTGDCVLRFTGAKYARTRRATGAAAENQAADIHSPCSW